MITSTVKSFEYFSEFTARIIEVELAALNAAAEEAAAVANDRAQGITEFHVVHAGRTVDGYAAGIKAKNPIWRVFDKGSLGKRTAALKRDRRKTEWTVRRGANPYTAHRHTPVAGGVDPRTISNPARTVGRHKLIAALRRG